MTAKASERDMEVLHGALCGYFLALLGGKIPETELMDTYDADGKAAGKRIVETGRVVRPSAGEVAVMAKFLKDNAIVGVAVEGSELSELQKKLAQNHARRGKLPTPADVQQAMKDMGTDLLQ